MKENNTKNMIQYLDEIDTLLKSFEAYGDSLNLERGDIRENFYFDVSTRLKVYWISLTSLHLIYEIKQDSNDEIQPGNKGLTINIIKKRKFKPNDKHINELVTLLESRWHNETFQDEYIKNLKSSTFFNIWCNFEDTLRELYDLVVPENTRKKNIEKEKDKFKNPPSRVPHLSILVITNGLLEVIKKQNPSSVSSKKDRKRARDIIDFLGACRNTLHSNSFYSGEDKSITIRGRNFSLNKETPIEIMTIDNLLVFVAELVEQFKFISQAIPVKGEVIGKVYKYQSSLKK